jgi:hypothetical protein
MSLGSAPTLIGPGSTRAIVIMVLIVAFVAAAIVYTAQRTPTPPAQLEDLGAEIANTYSVGQFLQSIGKVSRYTLDVTNRNFDLTVPSRDIRVSHDVAGETCGAFRWAEPKPTINWRVRVFLSDDTLAAECNTRTPSNENSDHIRHEAAVLSLIGKDIVNAGSALRSNLSPLQRSLDLTMQDRNTEHAKIVADRICETLIDLPHWHARVFLVDGSLAAECPINPAGLKSPAGISSTR